MTVVELAIPARPAYLSLVRLIVDSAVGSLAPGFTGARLDDLKLAVTEACSNAIEAHEAAHRADAVVIRCEMDESSIRAALMRHWKYEGVDYDKSHEIYHDDAILEFPQSGERFVGKQRFLAWRKKYPAQLDFRIRRISHDGDLWVAENLISYDGSPSMFTVNILQFRDDKIVHERLYVMDGFEPAPWRAEWAETFDPLEATVPE
jgi:anti-sigma regulatory factor (Ser/Thr protein kinase)